MELLYPLNGKAEITLNGTSYKLPKRHIVVIESGQLHSCHSYSNVSIFLSIHIAKSKLKSYLPQIDTMEIHCFPEEISNENFPYYLEACQLLDQLTRLYIKDSIAFPIEAEGIILQVLAQLLEHFSTPSLPSKDSLSIQRIKQITKFVQEHYASPISLTDVASLLGLNKEYFCRFFKKNTNMSFFEYVTQVRLSHVYYDLIHSDLSILEIMHKNGFQNQKFFNRSFRALYGCPPRAIRKRKNLS